VKVEVDVLGVLDVPNKATLQQQQHRFIGTGGDREAKEVGEEGHNA